MQFPARQNGRSLYDSGGSQLSAAMQSIQPFQFVEIPLRRLAAGISQSDGQYLPQLEGFGFTVIQADWPVTITPNAQQSRYSVGIAARPGVECAVSFKGLTLSYPEFSDDFKLRLIIWKQNVRYSEAGAVPYIGLISQVAYTTNTALSITGQIYIPENARFLESFSVYVPNTTASSCLLQFFDVSGAVIQSSGSFIDRRNGQAYNTAMQLAQYCEVVNVGTAGVAKFKAEPSVIPINAVRMSFAIQGTGLTTAGLFVNGVFS